MKRMLVLSTILFLFCACAPVAQSSPTELMPTVKVTPEVIVTQGSTMSPATQPVSFEVAWSNYHNEQLEISFEYPSAYDLPPYESCGVKVSSLPDGTEVSIGHRSFLLIQPANGVALQSYMDNLIAQKQWTLEFQEATLVGGENAIRFDYRFGGSRFGTATAAIHNDLIYVFNFSAGVFCDASEVNLGEGYVYEHWLESFMFTQ